VNKSEPTRKTDLMVYLQRSTGENVVVALQRFVGLLEQSAFLCQG
jgi:hypothetical protein